MGKIEQLRIYLKTNGLSGIIIPSNDSHFSEYIAPYWKCCSYVSGFTGSAATVVVTLDDAAIWVDSRYFIQADEQCLKTGFEVQKIGALGALSISQWIGAHCEGKPVIAVDGKLFSLFSYQELRENLAQHGASLKVIEDPFLELWQQRTPLPMGKVTILSDKYAGQSAQSKLSQLRIDLGLERGDYYLVTALDDIAWLLNIRGVDISFNPVVISYLVVNGCGATLFIDSGKIERYDLPYFNDIGVQLMRYDELGGYLKALAGKKVIFTPSKTNIYYYNLMVDSGVELQSDPVSVGTITLKKSRKNPIELQGFLRAMVEDGVALTKFYFWLEQELNSNNTLTEYDLAEKLHGFREESPLFRGDSFAAIVAMGESGAMPHYSVEKDTAKIIKRDNFLLIDSGGHYQCGTTDITRTTHLSIPTAQQISDYTAVLQGMIALTMAIFPARTTGYQLDILARSYLLKQCLNYGHGTSHGVGHWLNVHEGPQSIRASYSPQAIEDGMVISNEPAIYREGKYGIRIENIIACKGQGANEFGEFLGFNTLTLFPIDTEAIDFSKLSVEHREWLNGYHSMVYEILSESLPLEHKRWLRQKTQMI